MLLPSPLVQLSDSLFEEKELEVYLKRDDLIHPQISGNKWRKLKFNIEKFKQGGYEKVLTFGGAYSNHIAASAVVSNEQNIPFIGLIRGDELNAQSNQTLLNASENGMELIFISREEYNLRDEKYYHEELRRRYGNVLIIPEGGANYYGMIGCSEIVKEIPFSPDYMVVSAGTGTTAAGILSALNETQLFVVSALKGGEFLKDTVKQLLQEAGWLKNDIEDQLQQFKLLTDYHFGGYAKFNTELIAFINSFYHQQEIKLDQVYTGKMMYALYEQIRLGEFQKGSKIVAIHTGGIQGTESIPELFV